MIIDTDTHAEFAQPKRSKPLKKGTFFLEQGRNPCFVFLRKKTQFTPVYIIRDIANWSKSAQMNRFQKMKDVLDATRCPYSKSIIELYSGT